MSQHSAGTEPTTRHRTHSRRPRRLESLIAACATVGLLGVGAAVAVVGSAGAAPGAGNQHVARTELTTASATRTTSPATDSSTTSPATDSAATDDTMVADTHPVADPEPEPEPATPGVLVLSTNSIELPDNTYEGSFEVRNEGGSPVEWNWLPGDYGISVDVAGGTLAAGESVTVHFTINPFQLPVGDFLFANCIYNDEVAKDLHITGHRPVFQVNPGLVKPGLGLATS